MASQSQLHLPRQVLITQNTEYLVQGGVCIAVRSHRTGERDRRHAAIGSQLLGCAEFGANGSWSLRVRDAAPRVGQRVVFASKVMTSPLCAVTVVQA